MPRILHLTTRLNISGPALQAILLTATLRDLQHDTRLVAGPSPFPADSMMHIAQQYHIEPVMLPILRGSLNPITNLRIIRQLARVMRDYQPDVVHTHTTAAGFLGRLAAWWAGVPVVVHTLHMHPFRGYYSQLRTFLFTVLERIGARFADSIITVSEKLRREIVDRYHIAGRNRITVLPPGYDLASFAHIKRGQGAFRAAWGIPADAPLVGIIGRLLPVKNHALFLQAAVRVRAELPDAHFVIVGDGPLRSALQAQVRELELTNCVHFTGWQQDIASIYSDLNVLVISSHNEGAPVPMIEALAAGCPVVATDVGAVADVLTGTGGIVVPSGDARALAEGIWRTLRQPPNPEADRARILDRYSIERLAHDLDSLYRGLLTKKRRP
jgi:glycosyltransferase involved in cell wall biosynthesis